MELTAPPDYQAYRPRPFTRAERSDVTLLFGGLTWRAEAAMQAALEGSGYKARALPAATKADLILGRELADVGQCCPTAFTCGNLAGVLLEEAEKSGSAAVSEKFVYVTAGSCGSCRFGQYHQSYELALRNLGLEAFRLLFVQQGSPTSALAGDGLDLSPGLVAKLLLGVLAADAIQDAEYQIRPYELDPGATARAARAAVAEVAEACRRFRPPRGLAPAAAWALLSSDILRALRAARAQFDAVAVDRLRVRPKVKITGEFYLQTVEGDPNYNIHSWLEAEGAEVYPAAVVVWFDYLIRFAAQEAEDRRFRKGAAAKLLALRTASAALGWRYDRMRSALGGLPRAIPKQRDLRAYAAPYFDGRLSGGEGDMLIGKAIWAHTQRKAHMIAELSPYGCMPNTMSIGAMAAVQGRYPDMLYAPLEVKGDSEVHALSRCQMILTEAKVRAEDEFERSLRAAGLTRETARDRLAARGDRTVRALPSRGAAGTAANLVLELGGARL